MCGITGIYYFNNNRSIDKTLLKRSTDIIKHRGPDGEGHFIDGNIGLGHRRLSIIDLESGNQPMVDLDTDNVITYNGEIYNYVELRDELKRYGHKFRTNSDTEVILKSYLQWGVDCQNKFNGMWAFALWDNTKKRLFISRDRLGIKPLHYYLDKEKIIIASEIKSIFEFNVNKRINTKVLDLYFSLGYIPAPYSYFENVHKLKPGHFIVIENDKITVKKYWDLPKIKESELINDKEFVYSTFEKLLTDAVKIRMRSDVPFGAFLSGGLDSSSIVTLMSENSNLPIETFTIGFDNPDYDERDLAKLVVNKTNAKYHEKVVDPSSFDDALKKVVFHYDEPFGDSSAIPTGYVSEYASKFVKMVLTGDGGDEVLSGYNAYSVEKLLFKYKNIPNFVKIFGANMLNTSSKITKDKLRFKLNQYERLLRTSVMSFEDRLVSKASWLDNNKRKELLKNYDCILVEDFIKETLNEYNVKDPFYKQMIFNLKISLPDDMLTKVDRMSMANSIETRIPFLDYRLVEFMCRVDKNIKMNGVERKTILKETIGNRLPKELLSGPKKGFSVPLQKWFSKNSFKLKLNDLLSSNSFNNKIINTIILDNIKGKYNYGNIIWMLFVLNKINNENFNNT